MANTKAEDRLKASVGTEEAESLAQIPMNAPGGDT